MQICSNVSHIAIHSRCPVLTKADNAKGQTLTARSGGHCHPGYTGEKCSHTTGNHYILGGILGFILYFNHYILGVKIF